MRKYLLVTVLVLLAITISFYRSGGQSPTTITLPDGSTYTVECTLTGTQLACTINKLSGRDLSHWVLDLGICNEAVLSTDPPATYTPNDPTTSATGWKFEPILQQSFTYTLTLDKIYETGVVTATMKAGSGGNYASGLVTGPSCVEVIPTNTPTETPTMTPVDTATPTATPTDFVEVTPTPTSSVEPTGTPTANETPTLTQTPTATPTDVPSPTVTPTTVPVDGPTNEKDGPEPTSKSFLYLPLVGK